MKLTRARTTSVGFGLIVILATPSASAEAVPPRLKVSENRRFLVYEDGRPVLLPRGHGLGALSPAEPRGGRPLPPGSRAEGLHRDPGGGARRARRARRPEPLRAPAAPRQRPRAAGREGGPRQRLLGPRRLRGREGQRARAYRRLPAHLGRQVEQEVGRRARDLHPGERGRLRGVAGAALPRPRGDLDPRRRPAGGDRGPQGDPPGDGARPAQGRRRGPPHDVPPHGRQRLLRAVPRRGLARLQHAAERPRRRVHRALRRRRAPTTTARRRSR